MLKNIKFIFPLAFLCLISCMDEPIIMNDCIKIHVDEFYRQANLRGLHPKTSEYDIVLRKDMIKDLNVYGQTVTYTNIFKRTRIELDYDFVTTKTNSYRDSLKLQILVFHELGHALLYKKHTPISDRISIMYPGLNFEMYFDKHYRNQCLDKLFSKK